MRSHTGAHLFRFRRLSRAFAPTEHPTYPAAPKARHKAPNEPIGASRKTNAESAGVIQSIITIIRRKKFANHQLFATCEATITAITVYKTLETRWQTP